MTKAMPFLQKAILLSYDPRPFAGGYLLRKKGTDCHVAALLAMTTHRSYPCPVIARRAEPDVAIRIILIKNK